MRLFEHFPQDDKTRCPICGTADDKPCFLLPIDGTTRDWICEAVPTHADCISERLDKLQYNRDVGIVYMRIANSVNHMTSETENNNGKGELVR